MNGDGDCSGDRETKRRRLCTAAVDWSGLPEDLLFVVHCRVTSPLDHVRFAAVSKAWRAAASRHPALPLLLLPPHGLAPIGCEGKNHLFSPEDGTVLSVRPPSRPIGNRFLGSHDGGWVAAMEFRSLMIVNLFTGVEVAFSRKQKSLYHLRCLTTVRKIVFSESPTSTGCILAAITHRGKLALCRIGCPDQGWTLPTIDRVAGKDRLTDIAFCRGELHGIIRYSEIMFKFDIGVDDDGAPAVTAIHGLCKHWPESRSSMQMEEPGTPLVSIVELRGKLAMAVRTRWSSSREPSFKVFELVDAAGDGDKPHFSNKWAEVMSLGDYALFLGPLCSKAVDVSAVSGCCGVQRDCIYYSNHQMCCRSSTIPSDAVYFTTSAGGCCVYYREDESVVDDGTKRISSQEYYITNGIHAAIWLTPPSHACTP